MTAAPTSSDLGGSLTSTSSSRFESFTEAVPLSLSSMAHISIFPESGGGVMDGIRQVIQHTLWQCVNYARMIHPPPREKDEWTVRDLRMGRCGWVPVREGNETPLHPDYEIPNSLAKMKFQHCYSRHALICCNESPLGHSQDTSMAWHEHELEILRNWTDHENILGRISLLYATTEPLTRGELDGSERDDDMPPCILYKVLVEYRTLPPTGNQQARLAEELSMLSFGGSVDDDVKYGALASLYDPNAKYVLEIFGVRGRKYKFDLMDSTLSDGTIPTLPASREGDPFAKSMCVTVTNHDLYEDISRARREDDSALEPPLLPKKFAVTRMNLLLEGKPRNGSNFGSFPGFDDIVNAIAESFLILNPNAMNMVTATPSRHTLLLDPHLAGRVYVDGRHITTWGKDRRVGSYGVALFGMDLHSIPVWHGRIVDYEALKAAYALLWDEILVDAKLAHLNIATILLYRLLLGRDRDEDEELYDDDEDMNDANEETGGAAIDMTVDCLESQVLSSAQFDPVGIAAKALATKFAIEYGQDAFPCVPHERQWVNAVLPDRRPVSAPQRLMKVLRRGGYFDIQFTVDAMWATNAKPVKQGRDHELIIDALQLLEQSGCDDVAMEQVYLTSFETSGDPILRKMVCRHNIPEQTYYIHERLLDMAVNDYIDNENQAALDAIKVKAYLLGMYIAQEHPDGRVLPRYLLRVSI